THNAKSGVAHFMASNDEQCLMMIRELMGFLPSNNMEDPPVVNSIDDPNREDEKLEQLVPADPNKPYDMKELIHSVVDDSNFFEVMPHYAQNMLTGFARLDGKPVGIVANQPAFLA
ncbi:carboxyl transferase domain-containing protein, partial [Arthrospira platensis SPKY1]|nr:carboxyl transferase domain-containing protein [Arthrospira platensis SPKY1]